MIAPGRSNRGANRRRHSVGATLIELIVALVLLTVGLLPLLLSMNRIFMDTYALGTRSEAQLLCAEKIDLLKAGGFLELEIDHLNGSDTALIDDGVLPGTPYTRQTILTYQKQASASSFVDASPADVPTDFIKITTTVTWSVQNRPVDRSLTTMVTREGSFE